MFYMVCPSSILEADTKVTVVARGIFFSLAGLGKQLFEKDEEENKTKLEKERTLVMNTMLMKFN